VREETITAAYRRLARSRGVARAAARGRNILTALLSHRFADGIESDRNGEAALAQIALRDAQFIFDVGANVGGWTAMALAAAPRLEGLVAYEPTRAGAAELRKRFSARAEVEVVEAAVSDAPGEMTFYEEPGVGEGSSLVAAHSRPDATQHRVQVVTVDAELERLGRDAIDFLKVDAEGFDLHVLRGANGALAAHAVGVIQFEYNEPWLEAGSTLHAALSLLAGNGYETFLLKASGLHPYDIGTFGELFRYSNFVAFAPGRSAAFAELIKPPL
jgi:FkbM family methyltransferase